MQTDDLVRRARRGDGESLGCLFDRFYRPVFRYLLGRTGDRVLAEDMASEVFVEVAGRIRSFRGDGSRFPAWLFAIARHDLADHRRARTRRQVEPVEQVPEVGEVDDPADVAVRHLEAEDALRSLAGLTEAQREVILLRFAADLPVAEVAAILGKPVGAVKSMQHRALAQLRHQLQGEDRLYTDERGAGR